MYMCGYDEKGNLYFAVNGKFEEAFVPASRFCESIYVVMRSCVRMAMRLKFEGRKGVERGGHDAPFIIPNFHLHYFDHLLHVHNSCHDARVRPHP